MFINLKIQWLISQFFLLDQIKYRKLRMKNSWGHIIPMNSKTGIVNLFKYYFRIANFIIPGFHVKITTHRIILTHAENK